MLFKKSQLGWRLLRQSLAVLSERKKWLILPLIGRGFFFLIIILLTGLTWAIRSGVIDYNRITTRQIVWGYIIVLLLLWFANIVSAYFNAALIALLSAYNEHQQMRLRDSLLVAARRLWVIFCWILTHFTLGIMTNIFREKSRRSKRIQALLSGLSWSYANFLVPALLINEPMNFLDTLRRSSQLMFDFAGPQPKVNFSFTGLNWLVRLVSLMPLFIGYQIHTTAAITIGVTITIILELLVIATFNMVSIIILQALYQFIAFGKIFPHFHSQDIGMAISPRLRSRPTSHRG